MPMPLVGIGVGNIFYTGMDGLYYISDPTDPGFGPTTEYELVNDTTIVSSPAPYRGGDQNGRIAAVYITDAGGNNPSTLQELEGDGAGGWSLATRLSPPKTTETLVGDPAAYLPPSPWVNTILLRNSVGTLYELRWSNSLNNYVKNVIPLN
jgi:hypothetical protein